MSLYAHVTTVTIAAALLLLGCPADTDPVVPATDGTTDTDTGEPPPQGVFAFGIAIGQHLTAGPFPNDVLRNKDGIIEVGLKSDPKLANATKKAALLEQWDAYITERTGFGLGSPIWFPMASAPDLDSFKDRIQLVTLTGPETDKVVDVIVFYNELIGALGVFPGFGHYLVSDTTYAVLISNGVTTEDDETIEPAHNFRRLVTPIEELEPEEEHLTAAREAYAPLRLWLSANALSPDDLVVGTVFTTEAVIEYGRALLKAVDEFELKPPTRRYLYDTESSSYLEAPILEGAAALDAYFGLPVAPFEFNPGIWGWSRNRATLLPGYEQVYEGGTGHFGFSRVINGSIIVPLYNFDGAEKPVNARLNIVGGKPQVRSHAMAPFSLYLCDAHMDDPSNVPVAVFNHGGGGASRSDVLGYANANCRAGVATIGIDMIFHGSRRRTKWLADDALLVPTEEDNFNQFTGKDEPDYIGDPKSGAQSVAPLFAIEYDADPLIIEANLLQITADTYTLVRYLKEGDWSQILPGLTFDASHMFHNSLSFGTAFSTPLQALSDDFVGIASSVGTVQVLPINMPMAPGNAVQASGILNLALGTPTLPADLQAAAYQDFMVSLHYWLHQRGDPLPYAPHVLRFRPSDKLPAVVSNGNSWDETLYNPAQLTYANAIGLPTYTSGEEWTLDATVPGADTLNATPAPAGAITGNANFGPATTTAAIFFRDRSCHAQVLTALCSEVWKHPYPPMEALEPGTTDYSPVCAIHTQIAAFNKSLLNGTTAEIIAPAGTCEALYGPNAE